MTRARKGYSDRKSEMSIKKFLLMGTAIVVISFALAMLVNPETSSIASLALCGVLVLLLIVALFSMWRESRKLKAYLK
jgi:hypothetical protein